MDVTVSALGPEAVLVAVTGAVDLYSAARLRSRLDDAITQGHIRLVVDLDSVDVLDSTGLGVLVARLKAVRQRQGWLRLVCTRDKILRVFDITGLDQVFVIADSVEDALSR